MSVHNLPYVTHTISFNKALLLFAERLFLSQGGTPAKWARWIAAKDTADVCESRLLSSQEQMAKQDKVEFHIFIAEDVVAFMRKLLLANDPPAYVNTKQEGLFRAAPSSFDDAELIKALIARNIPVNSPVAGRFELPGMPELGSWENSYNFNKTGRIVFVAREVESALNNAAPLQMVENDNRPAHETAKRLTVEGIISTTTFGQARAVNIFKAEGIVPTTTFGQARAVNISTAKGIASTAQCGAESAPVPTVETAKSAKAKKRDRSTGRPNGRPRNHDRIINVGSKLICGWTGDVKARFVEAAIHQYGKPISRDWADELLTKTWDGYRADRREQKAKADNERAMNPNVRLVHP